MIDTAEMTHLMNLARLELSLEEAEQIRSDLNTMLGYFEQLQQVDTAGVAEMQRPIDLENVMRDDTVGPMFDRSVLEQLAPALQDGFVKVPRTVEAE